jgi:hypothetical protein
VDQRTQTIVDELLAPLDDAYLGPVKYIYCYLPLAGGCPAREFLDSLPKEARASYAKLFEYHAQGHQIRGDKWRPWDDGMNEYKDNQSKSRLMHITEKGNLIILLFGFTGKNENKVEQVHVNRANRMHSEYKERVARIDARLQAASKKGGKR